MSTPARFFISVLLAFVMLYLISLQPVSGLFLALALLGTVVAGQKIDLWIAERREQARLVEDCEVQHEAIMANNDDLGVYGRHQPPVVVSDWGQA